MEYIQLCYDIKIDVYITVKPSNIITNKRYMLRSSRNQNRRFKTYVSKRVF